MSLNGTVSAERIHIGFFGCRNAGKSSLVNAVTGQDLAVVSDVQGTTTDPVKKAMELLPLGPVVIIDTPGMDDVGALGEKRVSRAKRILAQTDIAILVIDDAIGRRQEDEELLALFREKKLPYLIARNKCDLTDCHQEVEKEEIFVSAASGKGIYELKERIGALAKMTRKEKTILSDLVTKGDYVVLVIPIDESAPKGRLILPQQQVLRELLDFHCIPICVQVEELEQVLGTFKGKVRLVITDSQAFEAVSRIVPKKIALTSFSILFARYKGKLEDMIKGAERLRQLKDRDQVLISEGCTHHRQCNDIGTVKLPDWIKTYCGADVSFSFTSGGEFPENPEQYALIVHCGGCMISEKEMQYRMTCAKKANVPMVNYGIAIAAMKGILSRSIEMF